MIKFVSKTFLHLQKNRYFKSPSFSWTMQRDITGRKAITAYVTSNILHTELFICFPLPFFPSKTNPGCLKNKSGSELRCFVAFPAPPSSTHIPDGCVQTRDVPEPTHWHCWPVQDPPGALLLLTLKPLCGLLLQLFTPYLFSETA